MDQQFETYERFLRKQYERLNAWILPGSEGTLRKRLILLCCFLVFVPIVSNFRLFVGIVGTIHVDFESFLGMFYVYLFVYLIPLGGLIMFRGKVLGWLIISVWMVKRIITGGLNLYYSKFWLEEASQFDFPLNDLIGFDLKQTLGAILVSLGIIYYLYNRDVMSYYAINRVKKVLPFVLGGFWVLLNHLMGVI